MEKREAKAHLDPLPDRIPWWKGTAFMPSEKYCIYCMCNRGLWGYRLTANAQLVVAAGNRDENANFQPLLRIRQFHNFLARFISGGSV
jgi:hypothetical protein